MDRTRRYTARILRELIRGSKMGFHSKSIRFEGGGRQNKIGLKRTGKSCRLRWVNYLHPGLKRGKMTPHEERLVLELHNKWGNRWSRIARKLPGRTDNEIKNYWRTHMRKEAQEKKKPFSPSSSSSSSSHSSSSTISTSPSAVFTPATLTKERSFYDTGGKDLLATPGVNKTGLEVAESTKAYSMDEIWKDIEMSEKSFKISTGPEIMGSPIWDYCPPTGDLWSMNEEEEEEQSKMMSDHFQYAFPFCNNMIG